MSWYEIYLWLGAGQVIVFYGIVSLKAMYGDDDAKEIVETPIITQILSLVLLLFAWPWFLIKGIHKQYKVDRNQEEE
jgi:uncharacterized membrane protein